MDRLFRKTVEGLAHSWAILDCSPDSQVGSSMPADPLTWALVATYMREGV
jgi:hypothetical protein